MFPKFHRICLEGNIGCGKTSLLNRLINEFGNRILEKQEDFCMLELIPNTLMMINQEPVKKWTKIGGSDDNLLEKMYTDPKRWAFTFEHYSQITRYNQMCSVFRKAQSNSVENDHQFPLIHLMERSIYSNRFSFVENFHQTGHLTTVEYTILDEWFEYLRRKPETHVNLFVYMRTQPQVLEERIRKRSRSGESSIPTNYLQKIHDLHEKCFIEKHASIWNRMPESSQVIVINADPVLDIVQDNFFKVFTDFIERNKQERKS